MDMIHKSLLESFDQFRLFWKYIYIYIYIYFLLPELMSEFYTTEDILKAKARINMI